MDLKRIIFIEFKKSSREEYLERDAQIGFDRILSKNYMAEFPGCEFFLIGVSFCGKHVSPLKRKDAKRA
jgi:hypothetical protein